MNAVAAASFLAVMLVPAGVAQTALGEDQADYSDRAGGAYVELLKQQDEFLNMTEREQRAYIEQAIDFINSDDPYESARNELLQELSAAVLLLQETDDEEKKARIQDQIDGVLGQLEELGVVSTDRLEGNEQFYADKYDEAKDRLHANDTSVLTLTADVDYGHAGSGDAGLRAGAAMLQGFFRHLDLQLHAMLDNVVAALGQLAHALGLYRES